MTKACLLQRTKILKSQKTFKSLSFPTGFFLLHLYTKMLFCRVLESSTNPINHETNHQPHSRNVLYRGCALLTCRQLFRPWPHQLFCTCGIGSIAVSVSAAKAYRRACTGRCAGYLLIVYGACSIV